MALEILLRYTNFDIFFIYENNLNEYVDKSIMNYFIFIFKTLLSKFSLKKILGMFGLIEKILTYSFFIFRK